MFAIFLQSTCLTALPSVVLKLPLTRPVSWFPSVGELFHLQDSLPGAQVPAPQSFVSLLSLSFAPPHSKEIGLTFWRFGVLCQCSEVVLWELFHMQMIFFCICWGERSLPILFLHHLEGPPIVVFLKSYLYKNR